MCCIGRTVLSRYPHAVSYFVVSFADVSRSSGKPDGHTRGDVLSGFFERPSAVSTNRPSACMRLCSLSRSRPRPHCSGITDSNMPFAGDGRSLGGGRAPIDVRAAALKVWCPIRLCFRVSWSSLIWSLLGPPVSYMLNTISRRLRLTVGNRGLFEEYGGMG